MGARHLFESMATFAVASVFVLLLGMLWFKCRDNVRQKSRARSEAEAAAAELS